MKTLIMNLTLMFIYGILSLYGFINVIDKSIPHNIPESVALTLNIVLLIMWTSAFIWNIKTMRFSLKNNKHEYLLNTIYGYSFIESDRTHKHDKEGFWFSLWECVKIIKENPEDHFKIVKKVLY